MPRPSDSDTLKDIIALTKYTMGFVPFTFIDFIDIILVAAIMFWIYRATRGTNAPYIISGIIMIYLMWVVVRTLNMELLSNILGQFVSVGVIALIIVFQPEIRRFLQMIGMRQKRFNFIARIFNRNDNTSVTIIAPIVQACREMSAHKTGALIVIGRQSDLRLITEGGIAIDAKISTPLLENIFFKNAPLHDGAVLIVSHDRAFMDACVDHVAALENRRVTTYTGNYSSYLKQREDNLEQMRAKRAAQERDIAHMQVFVDKFRYKPTKAAQAQERIRKIEQIKKELVILPEGHKHIDFKFPDPPRSGDMAVGLEGVSKSYGDKHIYSDIDLKLYRGEHVALVGPNGAGKSTLMKIIAGLEPPTTGTRDLGTNVGVAYYAQHALEGMTESNTVLQEIDTVTPKWTVPQQRSLLGAFLFSDNDAIEKQVRVLSGGEKALTAISLLFAIQNLKPSPFCLLDEIEAALDDNNVTRFAQYLHKLTKNTQFIVITHRRGTMTAADRLYGITMQEKGVSTLVSVDLLEDKLDR